MTLAEFIAAHRRAIPGHNDEERRLWVLNDESIYLWAKREGVEDI